MRLATFDFYNGMLIFGIHHQPLDGPWKLKDAFLFEGGSDPIKLGQAVRKAISSCKLGIPNPPWEETRHSVDDSPVLSLLGVKKYATFMKSAKSVTIIEDKGEYEITPYQNKGSRGGFESIDEKMHKLINPDDQSLGETLMIALEEAR